MGNLIDTIGLREALRKTKSWCENKFAKSADFNEVSAQVSDNKSLLTEIKGTFTALQSGNADVTKAQVATNTGRITQAESDLNDLSQQVSGKVGKSGTIIGVAQKSLPIYPSTTLSKFNGDETWTNTDGIISVTTTTKTFDGVRINATSATNNYVIVVNHKYLVLVDVNFDSTAYFRCGYADRLSKWGLLTSETSVVGWHRYSLLSSIASLNGGETTAWFSIYTMGTAATFNIKSHQLFDLTEMFGSGNEPTTAQAFAEALGYASIDDVPYIPFSASAITMPSVDSIGGLMAGKLLANEICLGEYTLRCNGSSLVAVDSSGNETTLLGGASTMSLDDDTTTE